MKNIMIALMTTFVAAGSLSYFNNCSKAVCSVPYNACANDKGCASTMDVCEKSTIYINYKDVQQMITQIVFNNVSTALTHLLHKN